MNDDELLARFKTKNEFVQVISSWTSLEKARFCSLARIIHDARLDWWHVDMVHEIRFGRKEKGHAKAVRTLGRLTGDKYQKITIPIQLGDVETADRVLLTDAIVNSLKAQMTSGQRSLPHNCVLGIAREGNWPDEMITEWGAK